ncbi:hypothetical protein COU57_06020 [Candidatus Pacearchaeota archaeon CG10_big_fil_rev_8_21_14_0_10_32_14]|nr:MAG: hypothetical protein COU57_06020 [Candidatus Pacearchaeota archaeon CG10_big_fil_rev_8_21_14_0_10_32_14]
MKLPIPFIPSRKDTDCGLVAPMMAFQYFGKKYSFDNISIETKQLESGMVWSLGIARASAKLGYKTKYFSSSITDLHSDLDFYKKYANDKAMLVLKDLQEESSKLGVQIVEKSLSLEELLSFVTEDSIPIVLLNWFVISGKDGYFGHFVPLTGYDEKFIYIHNPGMKNPQEFMPIEKSLFQKAWESKGTDKDTIVIYREKVQISTNIKNYIS